MRPVRMPIHEPCQYIALDQYTADPVRVSYLAVSSFNPLNAHTRFYLRMTTMSPRILGFLIGKTVGEWGQGGHQTEWQAPRAGLPNAARLPTGAPSRLPNDTAHIAAAAKLIRRTSSR